MPHHSNSPRLARDSLVLGPSTAINRDPTPVTSVNNIFQTVPQPSVSQQSTTSQPPASAAAKFISGLQTKYLI